MVKSKTKSKQIGREAISALPPQEYLRRYLRVAPLSLALFRSIEAKNIATQSLKRPILDLGCGFGEFAGVFFDRKIEVGVDISWEELVVARRGNRYKKLAWVDARELLFKDNYFATVLSVSVLEHIERVDEVLREVERVLKPGGFFVLTVNSNKINEFLFWPRLLGQGRMAKAYRWFYHRLFKHKTLWSEARWCRALAEAGFEVKICRPIISPRATAFFDFFLLTAWPSQVIKWVIGRRWAWRPIWFREWLVRLFGGLVEIKEKEGSNLFIVAQKAK